MNDGQDDLEDSKKKKKERKKRIKQKNLGYKSEDRFDEENAHSGQNHDSVIRCISLFPYG